MKKEWILNDEQLRRRKNSRLNNLANQQRQKQHVYLNPNFPGQPHNQLQALAAQQQAAAALKNPLSINAMDALAAARSSAASQAVNGGPLVSPSSNGVSLVF